MIISASRRTDIPAFYSEWLLNRIRKGYCCVVNPFNAHQISRVSLAPSDVDVIVFWTKDAQPLIPHLPELDCLGYRYFFQYTLNAYPEILEHYLPTFQDRIDTFRRLSEQVGPSRVIWRYDPIIISEVTSEDFHRETFAGVADALSRFTDQVVISIVDEYRAAKGRLNRLGIGYRAAEADIASLGNLIGDMAAIAASCGMSMSSCAEKFDLRPYGVAPGKCIDEEYLRKVFKAEVSAKKDKSQRLECGCITSKDIGSYDTCLHGCEYCYATVGNNAVASNYKSHNVDSPSMLGWYDYTSETAPDQGSLF